MVIRSLKTLKWSFLIIRKIVKQDNAILAFSFIYPERLINSTYIGCYISYTSLKN